jgi:hypothetical protein
VSASEQEGALDFTKQSVQGHGSKNKHFLFHSTADRAVPHRFTGCEHRQEEGLFGSSSSASRLLKRYMTLPAQIRRSDSAGERYIHYTNGNDMPLSFCITILTQNL